MDQLQRTRRVVGAAYAARHADPRTLEVVRALDRENAALRACIDAVEHSERGRTGRFVFGNTVSAIVLSLGLGLVVFWGSRAESGAALRARVASGLTRLAATTSASTKSAHR